jgi:hypothetical protein
MLLVCKSCGSQYSKRPSQVAMHGSSYCSRLCMSAGYRERLTGASNPNFKSAGHKRCGLCGQGFHHYSKKARYCSLSCAGKAQADHSPDRTCIGCGSRFWAVKKQQKYCSYGCFYRNPQYDLNEVQGKRMKYGGKKDSNHHEVAGVFERNGVPFYDLSSVGGGLPDGLVWLNGKWLLVEIKNPKTSYGKKGLNSIQKRWASQWVGGPVYILRCVADAEVMCEGRIGEIESFRCTENHIKAVEGK